MSDFYDVAEDLAPPAKPRLGPIFTAAYETECESCEDPIQSGEDTRADGRGGWIHADDQCERIAKQ